MSEAVASASIGFADLLDFDTENPTISQLQLLDALRTAGIPLSMVTAKQLDALRADLVFDPGSPIDEAGALSAWVRELGGFEKALQEGQRRLDKAEKEKKEKQIQAEKEAAEAARMKGKWVPVTLPMFEKLGIGDMVPEDAGSPGDLFAMKSPLKELAKAAQVPSAEFMEFMRSGPTHSDN